MVATISIPTEERIILYLSDFESLEDVYETTMDLTQKGISQNVDVQRKHISRYLKKLMEGGMISEVQCHVAGAKQRMKCYYLSWDGRRKAKDIREHVGNKKIKMQIENGEIIEMKFSEIDGATSVHLTLSDILSEAMKVDDFLVKDTLETIEEMKRRELDAKTQKSDVYRQALNTAWRDGVLTPSEMHLIGALKEHLGVSDEEHDLMENEIINNMKYGRAELMDVFSDITGVIGEKPTNREKEVLELLKDRFKIDG